MFVSYIIFLLDKTIFLLCLLCLQLILIPSSVVHKIHKYVNQLQTANDNF